VVADALSRPGEQCSTIEEGPQLRPVDFVEMARLQATCPDVDNPKMKVSYVLVDDEKLYGQGCQVAVVTATFLKCGSLKKFLAVENL
jgi:hypothetical protein